MEEEIVSALNGIEGTLKLIWLVLLCNLLWKDCNGKSGLREIEDAIKNLTDVLKRK